MVKGGRGGEREKEGKREEGRNPKRGRRKRDSKKAGRLSAHGLGHDCICHLFSFPFRMFTMATVHSRPFMLTPASCMSPSIAMMKAASSLAAEPQMRLGLFL